MEIWHYVQLSISQCWNGQDADNDIKNTVMPCAIRALTVK